MSDHDDEYDDGPMTMADIDPRTVPPSFFDYDYEIFRGRGYDIDANGNPGPDFYK